MATKPRGTKKSGAPKGSHITKTGAVKPNAGGQKKRAIKKGLPFPGTKPR